MPFFQCPSCNAQVHAAEDFAGKLVLCPQCQQCAPVPTNADATPQGITTPDLAHGPLRRLDDDHSEPLPSIRDPDVRAPGWFAWFTVGNMLIAVGLCVIIPLLLALLLPSTQRVHDRSSRTIDINNLKNIGLAIYGFHDANKRFPFNGSDIQVAGQKYSKLAQANDFRSGSWAYQILPFIDQAPLFQNAQPNRMTGVAAYMSPARGRQQFEENGGAWSDYYFNNYLNDPLQASKPDAADNRREVKQITDGLDSTVLVGQGSIDTRQYGASRNVTLCSNIFVGGTLGTMRAGDNGESAPGGVTLERDAAKEPTIGSWGGPYKQGAYMCMGDVTVRLFPYETQNFSSFLTPTGKENVIFPE